ncbi:TIGR00375 family protein [Bacillus canaveralius]|uniref:TIGR00375 family protein n=1 Tax=Bacillus canaveralius TaxID=1403243 RepID=A0A2N5GRJ6_9BACI|nr:TIGR00375 family protein [Bacillus canaveralius]PLR86066.1 TIGR00375 family protein [Bacillus canaveralius]PLS00185.1 TIGR00375 family protein [Bacillus canaveralius]
MNKYYADLHIHIGRTKSGKAVKITGAKALTFSNIIKHARDEKGLNMVGIIDCHSPEVIEEMETLLALGQLTEHREGGLLYGGLSVIPGSELEIYDHNCKGPIHVLCFFPTLKTIKEFSGWLSGYLKNINLSSQRIYADGKNLQEKVKSLGGLFIPAHVFTPFKSLYGKGVATSLTEVFDPALIDGVELGLSADSHMADMIGELHNYAFVSNSDAHSLGKIAREYQIIEMKEASFQELEKALKGKEQRRIAANYGLDPLLGKYHQTVCANCFARFEAGDQQCHVCGHTKFIKGVADRISELATVTAGPSHRPPYIHQVPLEFIPGLGPKILGRLLDHFGTEMAVLHEVPFEALKEVVPVKTAALIVQARNGELRFHAGGGGKYGKISD